MSRISASSAGTEPFKILGKGRRPATIRLFHARHARSTSPSANGAKDRSCDNATANASTVAPHIAGSRRSVGEPRSGTCIRTCRARRSSWPHSTLASRSGTYRLRPATPTLAPPPSTTGGDRTSTVTPPTSRQRQPRRGQCRLVDRLPEPRRNRCPRRTVTHRFAAVLDDARHPARLLRTASDRRVRVCPTLRGPREPVRRGVGAF